MAVKHEELYTPDLVPALTDILTSIKNDIPDDGILDDQFFNELILKAIHTFDTSTIRENLEIFILNADPGAVIPAVEILITENPLILTSAFTGDYEVSFSDGGTVTGTVDLTIHNQLHITGTLHALIGDLPVAGGEVTEDGTLTFTVAIASSLLMEFMGTIFEDGSVEGTFTFNDNGEIHGPYPFSGHRI